MVVVSGLFLIVFFNFYDLYCKFLSVVDVSPWLFLLRELKIWTKITQAEKVSKIVQCRQKLKTKIRSSIRPLELEIWTKITQVEKVSKMVPEVAKNSKPKSVCQSDL